MCAYLRFIVFASAPTRKRELANATDATYKHPFSLDDVNRTGGRRVASGTLQSCVCVKITYGMYEQQHVRIAAAIELQVSVSVKVFALMRMVENFFYQTELSVSIGHPVQPKSSICVHRPSFKLYSRIFCAPVHGCVQPHIQHFHAKSAACCLMQ